MSDETSGKVLLHSARPDALPPDTDLVGRDDELETLHGFLAQGKAMAERNRMPTLVNIYGEAGVGKSALGIRFAYSIEEQYPDGVLWLDLNTAPVVDGVPDTSQILRGFLLDLWPSRDRLPQNAQDLPNAFVKATDGKRLIVFLDNVNNYRHVKDLVPRSSTCLVVSTSNERLQDRWQSLRLKPLSIDSAAELFGIIAPSRNVNDAEARKQLVRVLRDCAGLPIAIRVLAARLEENRGYPLARIAEDLERYQYKPHFTSLFGADRRTIEACFRVSYDALNDVQSMLFRRLGVVPGESFDVVLAAFLGDLTVEGAELILDELRALQLIQETQDPDYFTMHSLWRQFTGEQLDATEAAEQLTRVLTFYREQAEEADLVIRSLKPLHDTTQPKDSGDRAIPERNPAVERDRALDWMEKQHKNLVAVVKRACDEGQPEIAWRTSRALMEFFEIRGMWESWVQTHEAAEKVVFKQSLGSGYLNYGLGRLHGSRRHWPEAIARYHTAIALFRQHGEQVQVGRSLNSLGDAYRYMRNWDAAENCFKRSLEILEEAHYPRQIAIAKRSMSTIHRQRGEFKEAEQLCLQAIAILEKEDIRDERWIAATKLSLADIYLDSGSRDARGLLEGCLEVFEKLKDTHWLILTRRSLGEALREEDEYDAAITQLKMALAALKQTEDDHWEGQILHSMGMVYLDQQDKKRAGALFGEALDKFRHARDTLWEARTQISIGRTEEMVGRVADALAAYHAAWPLLVEQGANADLRRLESLLNAVQDKSRETNPGPGRA